MATWAESGPLSVDRDGRLTFTRPDAEGEPDEFVRLGPVADQCWIDLDALGVAEDHARLLASWMSADDGRDVD